jgi:predicted nucleic acid-binding protein
LTRFVVDTSAVLHILAEQVEIGDEHQLLAPGMLRSQLLSSLHEAVHRGEIESDVALVLLSRFVELKIRLLSDAVLRRRAWRVADQLGWASTYDAEYVALTQLQADALVTLDPELQRAAGSLVTTAAIADLA